MKEYQNVLLGWQNVYYCYINHKILILTDWKHWLILTIDTGAIAKVSLLILLQLQGRSEDKVVNNDNNFKILRSSKQL